MKEIIDYIVKNKYVIICIVIAVALYATGIVNFLAKFIILIALILIAIYIGKKLQENNGKIENIFKEFREKKDNTVYYYQESKKEEKKDNTKK